jgi:hypothetical protein
LKIQRLVDHLINPPLYLSILLLIILGYFQFRYGIYPAWIKVNSDFPNYYTSSRLITGGADISKIYNDNWFQNKIFEYGMNERGKFSPFPPPTAFVMVPLSFFAPLTAARIFLLLNITVLLFISYLFERITEFKFITCLNFILLSGTALWNDLSLGQIYLILLITVVLGYHLLEKEKLFPAGILWGLGAAVKYFPLVFIPVLLIKKHKSTLTGMFVALAGANIAALFFFGFHTYYDFLSSVFVSHLNGELSGQSKYSIQFQSWNSLLRNLFVYDAADNKLPLCNNSALFYIARGFIYLVITVVAASTLFIIRNKRDFIAMGSSLSLLTVFVLSPASASYHLLLLSFPVILLIKSALENRKYINAILFVSLYSIIGFAPLFIEYTKFNPAGLFFQYYRLWFVLLLFTAANWFILSGERR